MELLGSTIMRTLSMNFMVLQALGLWAPLEFSSLLTRILYKLYSYTILCSVSFHLATGFIGLILTCRSVMDIAHYGCRLLGAIITFGKMLNVIISRETIIGIIKTFETDPCAPRDAGEILIQNEHNRNLRHMAIQYIMVMSLTISLMISHTIMYNIPAKEVPRRAWFPFDNSHGVGYWISLIYQVMMLTYLYSTMFGYNTFVCGMFLELSTKLTILQYRFTNLRETSLKKLEDDNYESTDIAKIESALIIDCVNCHLCVFNLARRVNSTFSLIFFCQYVTSIALLCLSIYTVSGMKMNLGFIYFTIYLAIMLVEIFLYCSCAHEVTLESEKIGKSVFAGDWLNFTKTTWKSMSIIASQSCHPIIFTSGYFVVLSLDSFKSIIKVAYSVFNAMKSL